MLRSLSSFQNLLSCLWSLNPWKYFIYNGMRFLHVSCDSLWLAIVVISSLFEYLIEKFPRTFSQRIHYFIFFCSTFFVISFILVHYFGPNWSLFIDLISLSLFLFISNCFEEFKYGSKVFLFDNLIYIGILIPLLKISKWWIKRFRVIVFHLYCVTIVKFILFFIIYFSILITKYYSIKLILNLNKSKFTWKTIYTRKFS